MSQPITTPAIGPSQKAAQVINPSPRTRFQSKPANLTNHRSMIDSEAFERASDAALAEYCLSLADQVRDGNTALAAGFRLLGAHEAFNVLKTLADPAPIFAPRRDLDNLIDMTPKRQ